jgi:hypothetical protein
MGIADPKPRGKPLWFPTKFRWFLPGRITAGFKYHGGRGIEPLSAQQQNQVVFADPVQNALTASPSDGWNSKGRPLAWA